MEDTPLILELTSSAFIPTYFLVHGVLIVKIQATGTLRQPDATWVITFMYLL